MISIRFLNQLVNDYISKKYKLIRFQQQNLHQIQRQDKYSQQIISKLMSYFLKKAKPDQSSFNCHIDESTISNRDDDILVVNSNIFNKSNIQPQNQNLKIGYSQISQQTKNCSPISYLKNFKKNNSKSNQENIYCEQSKLTIPNNKNNGSLKKQYEHMMNQLMGIQTLQQSNRFNNKQSNPNTRHVKNKSPYEEKHNPTITNQQKSSINHPFLNDQQEQSMQQLLNSSINQFEKFLQQQNDTTTVGGYEKNHNTNLHKTLSKFKSILKEKLEHGLIKQKQEMKNMLSQYVELITKLLHDKQEMSNHLEQLEEELNSKINQILSLQRKVQDINHEKDQHIHKTKQQIDEFLIVIEQFQNQAREETQKFQELQKQIDRLKPFEDQVKQFQLKQSQGHKRYSSQQIQDQQKRIQCQSQKIQTLLQLLEKSQHQTNSLKEILSKQNTEIASLRKEVSQQSNSVRSQNSRTSQGEAYQFTQQQMQEIKAFYEQKIQELQIEHEEEFIEYEKAIKQTLSKKDECIERLNFIISQLRDGRGKSPFKGRSSENLKQQQSKQNRSQKLKNKNSSKQQDYDRMSQKTFNQQEIIE